MSDLNAFALGFLVCWVIVWLPVVARPLPKLIKAIRQPKRPAHRSITHYNPNDECWGGWR